MIDTFEQFAYTTEIEFFFQRPELEDISDIKSNY